MNTARRISHNLLRAGFILALAVLMLWQPLEEGSAQKYTEGINRAIVNAPADPYWYGYGSGNDIHSNILIDGDYVWTGSSAGLIRWEKPSGTYTMFMPWDGLATFAVDSIVKDLDGNYWFGTYSGISKYDGRDWTTYTYSDFGFSSVWRSTMDPDGNLWFGGYLSGLSKYDGSTWTHYESAESGLQGKNVTGLDADSQGNIWAIAGYGAANQLIKFDGSSWTITPQEDIPGCTDNLDILAVSPEDDVWATCSDSLVRLSGGTWTSFSAANGVNFNPRGIAFASDGTVYSGGYDGVYRLNNVSGNFEQVMSGFDLDQSNNNLEVDAEGTIWAGSEKGLYHYDGATTTRWMTTNHLSNNSLRSITIDPQGQLWAAADDASLSITQFDGQTWTGHCPFDSGTPQVCQGANDISAGDSGDIWAAGQGLARYRNGAWSVFTTPDADSDFYLVREQSASIIRAVTSQRLFTFDGVSGWSYTAPPGGGSIDWRDMAVRGNEVWLTSYNQVYLYDGTSWTVFDSTDGLPADNYRSITASDDAVWVASEYGLARYSGSAWTTYTTDSGLQSNDTHDVAISPTGIVWVGYDSFDGMAYLDGANWVRIKSKYLVNNDVEELVFAPDGNLWILNGSWGIRIYNPQGVVWDNDLPDAGGTTSSLDGSAVVGVGPNLFDEPVIVTIQSNPIATQPGLLGVGPSYDIRVLSSNTQQPLDPNSGQTFEITFAYNPTGLSPEIEQNLGLYWFDGANWVLEPTSQLNQANRTVSAQPDHLSRWAVMGIDRSMIFIPSLKK